MRKAYDSKDGYYVDGDVAYIAGTGPGDVADLVDDISILEQNRTLGFQKKHLKNVIPKNIHTYIGHSLGGNLANEIAPFDARVIALNPGVGQSIFRGSPGILHRKHTLALRTAFDPVSGVFGFASHLPHSEMRTIRQVGFDPHGINNFPFRYNPATSTLQINNKISGTNYNNAGTGITVI